MKIVALVALVAVFGVGCSKPPAEKEPDKSAATSLPPGGTPNGDVKPMTTTPIPNAPVSGGTSFGDGGGSLGTAAKGKAKDVAQSSGSGSLGNPDNQDDDDDSGDN